MFISTFIVGQEFDPQILFLPDSLGASDFSFLNKELKGVQVVLLGENTHYDGNVFKTKTEIIKFLHKKMGFKTIAFESSIYDVWRAMKEIDSGEDVSNSIKNALFSVWAETEEFKSFIDYFEQNKTELKIFGFDNQIPNATKEDNFVGDLFRYCNNHNLILEFDSLDLGLLIESFWTSYLFDEKDITYSEYISKFQKLINQIALLDQTEEHFYWRQILESLLSVGKKFYFNKEVFSTFVVTKDDNIRDQQMAENLLAYIEEYPEEKIICWGANAHFTNNMDSVRADTIKNFIPMGSYIKNHLGNKVYSLAMVSAVDSIDLGMGWEQTPIKSNSFEQFLKQQNRKHLFINSNQEVMTQEKEVRFFSPITFVKGQLNLLHDGYLFFNEIHESTLIEKSISTAPNSINKIEKNFERNNLQKETLLNEVVLKGKYSPKYIIKRVIQKMKKNYPSQMFNSKHFANYEIKVDDKIKLSFQFLSHQFDRGYNQVYRNSQLIEQFRWIEKGDSKPKFSYFTFYRKFDHPHIKYLNFLSKRKLNKFHFEYKNNVKYKGEDVFVLSFYTERDHFNFTSLSFPSHYSGELYILKKNFAICKIIQNWTIKKFTEEMKYWSGELIEGYSNRKILNISTEHNFTLGPDDKYYLKDSKTTTNGLIDGKNNSSKWEENISSYWNSIKKNDIRKISFREEQKKFKIPKMDSLFWMNFDLEKFKN